MKDCSIKFGLPIFLAAALLSAGLILFFWRDTAIAFQSASSSQMSELNPDSAEPPRLKPPRQEVKGIYLTAYSAGDKKKVDGIIKLLNATELNAVVIDIKDYSGKILYNSKLKLVNKLKTKDNRAGDLKKLIDRLHRQNIYVIARQTVFQDPILAEKKPEWAIKSKKGGVWLDYKGLAWVDPTRREIWDYNLAIAKEAIAFGFDEINFDYMRFPSDGKMSEVVYTNGFKKRYEAMREFYEFLSEGLKDEPVWTSIDMFGLVMEGHGEFDMNIGQRLADAVDNFDYICPMMYPSHYPAGHLKFKNPAEHPAEIIVNGMEKGLLQFFNKRAEVRPWLQAFNIGAVYDDGPKIRAQLDATESYTGAGWLLWNAANRYTGAGLKI